MAAKGDDYENHKFNVLREAMHNFHLYPYNLSLRHTTEKIKFVSDFRQHFDQTKDHILLVLGQNIKGFRRKLIEKKIRVEFHDAGLRETNAHSPSTAQGQPPATTNTPIIPTLEWGESFASSWDSKEDTDVYVISNAKHLEDTLGISPLKPNSHPTRSLRDTAPVERSDSKPRADPITEELLLKILTYHQVSPCFLNFLAYFGHEPLSGAGDLFFGGFRSLKSFSDPVFGLKALDRSGYHYQLAFEFRTVFRPSSQDAEYADRQPGEREVLDESVEDDLGGIQRGNNNNGAVWRLLPSWLRPRDDDTVDEAATEFTAQTTDNPDLWPVDQCAVYHHFDVENGKSLWMMTAAEGEGNNTPPGDEVNRAPTFRDVKDARFSVNVLSSSSMEERFRASLAVLLWLTDWSLSEYGQYITMLDDDLQKLTRPYIEDVGDGGPVREIGLKKLNRYMEKLDEIIVALQGNLRVCRAISKFYRDELLQDRKLRARNLPWVTDRESRDRIREDLNDFQEKMRWVCTSTQEMLRRAVMVKQVGVRRENTLHRLLQNRDVRTTNELAKVTNKDSSTMRVFSAITLILLPVSVVSTVFSAGIVSFEDGTGGFAGSWSGPAAVWWAGLTIVLTMFVRWAGERWRERAILAAMDGNMAKTKPLTAVSESRHESWATQVRRVVNDVRVHVQPYKHSIRVGYARGLGYLKRSLVTARPRRPPPRPEGSLPRDLPYSGGQYPQGGETGEHLPPLELDARSERGIYGHERGPGPSDCGSPQELAISTPPADGAAAIANQESEELPSKGFDQASVVEQGLVRVAVQGPGEGNH